MSQWGTAEEVVEFVEKGAKDIVKDDYCVDIPWNFACSDHRAVSCVLDETSIITWNVLNPKYLKHLQADFRNSPSIDESQHLSHCKFANPDVTSVRLALQINDILDSVEDGYIVCLQEVGEELMQLIKLNFAGQANLRKTSFDFLASGNDPSNQQVVLWDPLTVECCNYRDVKAEGIVKGNNVQIIEFMNTKSKKYFWITSVHVNYQKNAEFSKLLAELPVHTKPLYVAGDFNMSSRTKTEKLTSDHILDHYCSSRFKFLLPKEDDVVTAVNKYENVGTCAKMLDKLDYIMIVMGDEKKIIFL